MNKVALQQAATALNNVTTKPKPIEELAKPKAIEDPDIAFMISARMMRAPVVFEFNDGTQLTGIVQSFGRYSISIAVDERSEIIWKHAIKRMRRA
jgi:RNA chaperone Hfq